MSPGTAALEAAGGQGTALCLEPPQITGSADTLIFAQRNQLWTSDFQTCMRINLCRSEPPALWGFVSVPTGNWYN